MAASEGVVGQFKAAAIHVPSFVGQNEVVGEWRIERAKSISYQITAATHFCPF